MTYDWRTTPPPTWDDMVEEANRSSKELMLRRVVKLLASTDEDWPKGEMTLHKELHRVHTFHAKGAECAVCQLVKEIRGLLF